MSSLGRTESRAEKDRQKQIQDKCQTLLAQMLRDEDNKYCVDCDAKGPRWASWNLGIFLCIRCAGIHRNLGVHISKVKSVNLDSWTPEQVVSLQQMGNSRARAVYEATLPDSWRRPQTDSNLENFIRAKYQHKRYIAKEWVPPPTPKVDWDKELDEEAERQRKRKKEKQTASQPVTVVRKPMPEAAVPALPKPSSSPKTSRNSGGAAPQQPQPSAAGIDLLGLNSPSNGSAGGGSDDVFSNFLSGPTPERAPPSTAAAAAGDAKDAKGRTAEEESFFNQPAVLEDKKQLTKDSIMALYSQQSSAPPMHAPVGSYQQNANPMAFNNGLNQFGAAFGGMAPAQNVASNPFFSMGNTGQFAMQLPQQMSGMSLNPAAQPQHAMPGLQGVQMPGLGLQGFAGTSPAQQFGGQTQLNQLNQLNPLSNSGQTFTMHLWQ